MSREFKYITLAAMFLFFIAFLIVEASERNEPTALDQSIVSDDSEITDSVATEPNAVKDAYTVIEEQKKAETEAKIDTQVIVEKQVMVAPKSEVTKPKEEIRSPEVNVRPSTVPSTNAGSFVVQTAVVSTRESAQHEIKVLKSKGFSQAEIANKGVQFAIYAGRFQSANEAKELKKKLDALNMDSFVKKVH